MYYKNNDKKVSEYCFSFPQNFFLNMNDTNSVSNNAYYPIIVGIDFGKLDGKKKKKK